MTRGDINNVGQRCDDATSEAGRVSSETQVVHSLGGSLRLEVPVGEATLSGIFRAVRGEVPWSKATLSGIFRAVRGEALWSKATLSGIFRAVRGEAP